MAPIPLNNREELYTQISLTLSLTALLLSNSVLSLDKLHRNSTKVTKFAHLIHVRKD